MYGIYKAAMDKRLKPVDKAILLFMFKMCGTKGYCWPSYNHIADKVGIHRRYAIMRVKYLEKLEYIKKGKGTRKDNPNVQSSNKYFINNNPE